MLKQSFKKYTIKLLIFSIILAGLIVVLQVTTPQYALPVLPYLILFFFVITLFTHYIILRGIYISAKKFVSNYTLATMIKFLSYLIFFLIYIVINKENRWLFAGSFAIIYFAYAIFEVIVIKAENKTEPDKKKKQEFTKK